jgi:hypothetical protein
MDLDRMISTYKKQSTVEEKQQWETDLIAFVKSFIKTGRITGSEFEERGYPLI